MTSLETSGSQAGKAAITRLLKESTDWALYRLVGLKGSRRQSGPFLYGNKVLLSDKENNPRTSTTYALRL